MKDVTMENTINAHGRQTESNPFLVLEGAKHLMNMIVQEMGNVKYSRGQPIFFALGLLLYPLAYNNTLHFLDLRKYSLSVHPPDGKVKISVLNEQASFPFRHSSRDAT